MFMFIYMIIYFVQIYMETMWQLMHLGTWCTAVYSYLHGIQNWSLFSSSYGKKAWAGFEPHNRWILFKRSI